MAYDLRKAKSYKLLVILSISITTFLLIICFGPMTFEPSGDGLFNLISAGVFGDDNQYLLFSNILLGYLLKYLYFLFPQINWYLWVLLLSELLSIVSICFVVTRNTDLISSTFLSLLINLFIGWECYTDIQFTVAAAVCAVGGLALLLAGMKEKSVMIEIFGMIIYFIGFLWRKECAIMIVPFYAVWIIVRFLSGDKKLVSMRFVLATIVLCATAFLFNYSSYNEGSWKYYSVHSRYRAAIIDHTPVFYTPGVYDEIGVTEAEADYFRNWYFADPDKMPLEKLRELYRVQYSSGDYSLRISLTVIKDTLREMRNSIGEHRFSQLCMVILGLSFILGILKRNKKILMLTILSSMMIVGCYWYFVCINRVVWRVEIGVWLAGAMIVFPEMTETICLLWKRKNRSIRLCLMLISASLIVGSFIHMNKAVDIDVYDNYHEMFEKLGSKDGIYLGSLSTGSLRLYDSPYDINGSFKGLFDNYVQYGGIVFWAGFNIDRLNSYGITNPTTSLFERDDVYYIAYDWEAENLLDYLQKEYDDDIQMERIDSYKDVSVWKYQR